MRERADRPAARGRAHDPARRRLLLGALLPAAAAALPSPAAAQALDRLRERGRISVAVYNDMPPFSAGGRGIDIELAQALAGALDLKLALLPFSAGENMADDLRNMVWRGHYLGFGPADLMLHVPVDAPLINATPQARIFAPYYRETVAIARRLDAVPELDSLAPLAGRPVAVPGQSLAGWLLLGADGGAYRDKLTTQHEDGTGAAQALLHGEVVAAAGNRTELESVVAGDARYAITPLPSPRAPRDGWAVGCAVKAEAVDLAQAVQAAMNRLADDGRLKDIFARSHVAWRRA